VEGEDLKGTWSTNFKQQDMAGLLKGNLPPHKESGYNDKVVARSISAQSLIPMTGVTYWRSAFEDVGKTCSITLEEDLRFRSEEGAGQPKMWSRIASEGFTSDSITTFPYTVLCIRGQRPAWLAQVALLTLTEVHGFSKGLHGSAVMQRPKGVPPAPWLADLGLQVSTDKESGDLTTESVHRERFHSEISPQKSIEASLPNAASFEPVIEELTILARLRQCAASFCKWDSPWKSDEMQVDSKTMLANERTFLRWLRIAILVSSISAGLMATGTNSGQVNGCMLAVLAVLLAILPLFTYLHRQKLLEKKEKIKYAESVAPMFLGVSLAIVFFLVLVMDILFSGAGVKVMAPR
jgi:uncharacterized membrane protein YidH (DUF202 family)